MGNILSFILAPFLARRRRIEARRAQLELESLASREQQKTFRYEALHAATGGFGAKNKLGEGGFGPVYRGKLADGRDVAVKRLSAASRQGDREFKNEATLLSRVQHKNVVNLIGFCERGEEKLLVYEYVANESLDKMLFQRPLGEEKQALDWQCRFDIIAGVARGLSYLHEDAHTPIIHRDIKASNILLDKRLNPKIADFGMARLFLEGGKQTHVQTRIAGTNAYMAPEYLMHGILSTKSDVFSYGVLVLEIISGSKNSSFMPPPRSSSSSLLDWAWKLFKKGQSLELLDPAIGPAAVAEEVELCVHVALLCLQADPKLRPDMKRVVILLSRKAGKLDDPARPGSLGLGSYTPRSPALRSSQYTGGTGSSSASSSSHVSTSNATDTGTFSTTNTAHTNPGTVLAHQEA